MKHSRSVIRFTQQSKLIECPDCGKRAAVYHELPVSIPWDSTPRAGQFCGDILP